MIGLLFVAPVALAQKSDPKVVHIAFGESLEPYVMQDGNSGIDVDIVRAALKARGYTMVPVLYPKIRLFNSLDMPNIDARSLAIVESGGQGVYSDPYDTYENVAIALASSHIQLHKVSDLGKYRILAFAMAKAHLTPEFKQMAVRNPWYSEASNQMTQPRALLYKHVDVVICERRIFYWMVHEQFVSLKEIEPPTVIYHLFPPTDYRLAFRDPHLRDEFDLGLQTIKRNGLYQKLLNRIPAIGS
jgi:ABC-type amino acid transport substrate-binding protein